METTFTCSVCGETKTHKDSLTTGYGIDKDDNKVCFACCGDQDRADMAACKAGDKFMLYLTHEPGTGGPPWYTGWHVTNWPGTLDIANVRNLYSPHGHNWGLSRRDVWFQDHTGADWWGYKIGDNTDICHCMKLKAMA